MTAPTTAALIAERYHNDGTRWDDDAGVNIEIVCREHADPQHDGDPRMCDTHQLYTFDDGSQIVLTGSGWTHEPEPEDLASFGAEEDVAPDDLCDGSGTSDGNTPCGAEHVRHGASLAEDIRSHACEGCGEYTSGAETGDGGLCDDCSTSEVSSGQRGMVVTWTTIIGGRITLCDEHEGGDHNTVRVYYGAHAGSCDVCAELGRYDGDDESAEVAS